MARSLEGMASVVGDDDDLFADFDDSHAKVATHIKFDTSDNEEEERRPASHDSNSDIEDDGMFMIDTVRDDSGNESSEMSRSFSYGSIGDDLVQPDKPKPIRRQSTMKCFNCEGPHRIGECDQPRDGARIAKNKRLQRDKTQEQNRYHNGQDGNNDAAGGFRPGRISKQLEEALGIRWGELPEWIYRMRRLGFVDGYPPGHLKAAATATTSTTLTFHCNTYTPGSASKAENDEEDNDCRAGSPTLDADKVIYYYGFNVEGRSNRRDDPYQYPPFPVFVKSLENELKRKHHERPKHRPKSAATRSPDRETQEESNGGNPDSPDSKLDVTPPKPPVTDGSPDVIQLDDDVQGDQREGAATPDLTSATNHLSSTSYGTPTLRAGGVIAAKPTLASFGLGIVPFDPQDEPPPGVQGGMDRIRKLISRHNNKTNVSSLLPPALVEEFTVIDEEGEIEVEAGEIVILDDDHDETQKSVVRKRQLRGGQCDGRNNTKNRRRDSNNDRF